MAKKVLSLSKFDRLYAYKDLLEKNPCRVCRSRPICCGCDKQIAYDSERKSYDDVSKLFEDDPDINDFINALYDRNEAAFKLNAAKKRYLKACEKVEVMDD